MKIEYDKPFKVTEKQYYSIMNKLQGAVAGRRDEEGNFLIKLWMLKYENVVKNILENEK
jgi:hypothetical protein